MRNLIFLDKDATIRLEKVNSHAKILHFDDTQVYILNETWTNNMHALIDIKMAIRETQDEMEGNHVKE